jgi:glycerol-3-phosphate dehydrogenase (NAD(P)+)
MKTTVLGCGRWGSFIASYLAGLGHTATLWGRKGSANLRQLMSTRRNEYLELPSSVVMTDNLDDALRGSDAVFIAITTKHFRNLAKKLSLLHNRKNIHILCMKGLETGTGMRMTEVLKEECGKDVLSAVWVGPGHVQSFVKGVPGCMVIDSESLETAKSVVSILDGGLIRFYYGDDILGTEVGAASKNVIGIAAGILDGMGIGELKGALMARGAREVSRLVEKMGGRPETVYGLSHLGDYEATLFSPYSRNRRFGESLVKNTSFEKSAEGVSTVKALMSLAGIYDVELPISSVVYSIIYEKADPYHALPSLFTRPLKYEFKNKTI